MSVVELRVVTWEIVPATLTVCKRFVREHHRHNDPPTGWYFGFGLAHDGELVGVCAIGHPQAPKLQAAEPRTVEILRVAVVEGTKNANSRMYGNACRMATAGGYTSAITYTLPEESGASLRAAGFVCESETAGGRPGQTWNVASRPRYEENSSVRRRFPTVQSCAGVAGSSPSSRARHRQDSPHERPEVEAPRPQTGQARQRQTDENRLPLRRARAGCAGGAAMTVYLCKLGPEVLSVTVEIRSVPSGPYLPPTGPGGRVPIGSQPRTEGKEPMTHDCPQGSICTVRRRQAVNAR